MPFGPHPCDDPNHGKTVGPVDKVDMVMLTIGTLIYWYMLIRRWGRHRGDAVGMPWHWRHRGCGYSYSPWDAVVCGTKLFPSLKVCEVLAVNGGVVLKMVCATCRQDRSQRTHSHVEIACQYMFILVASVPMYGGLRGVSRLGLKGSWSCLCQAPGGKCREDQRSQVSSSMLLASNAMP